MELTIREQRRILADRVAGSAVSALRVLEDREPPDRFGAERVLVASIAIPIKGRVTAQDGPLEAGERRFDVMDGDSPRAEGTLEAIPPDRIFVELLRELCRQVLVRYVHLHRIRDGSARLLFQPACATIPKQERKI